MAYRGREYNDETAANLLRSVRQQEAQLEILSRELQEERRNITAQLEKNKYNSETASVSSLGSSTDESFVWRGDGPGSIGDDAELTDEESRMSGSALVDSCLKVLQERGLNSPRDDQDPLYSRQNMDSSSTVSGHSNSLVNQDWERQLMEADLTPGSHGQSVKRVVTHTEMRTVKTVDGRVVQDSYKPGSTHTTIERYKYGMNGDGRNTPPVSGDEYRSGRRGPGSHSSVEEYRSQGSRSGYSSADEGRRTPTANGPPGHMSDGYHTPTGSRSGSQSGYGRSSQSLPRQSGRPTTPRGGSSASMPRMSSTARGPSTTYNLSIRVGDVKGSGTDGNVYIQLFGERGNTAKIQLRQAGDNKNKFEKGRTYKFTVDTVDIGKVDRIKLSHDHTGYGSGFYVEEVEVEVPARQDRVKFPCRCWLAQDVDDGKIEREMFAVSQLPNKSYTMSVKLGDVASPDTNLYIQLFGDKGETSKIMLRPVGSQLNKFEKGRTYKFTVETVDIGKCEKLRIGHDSRGPGKGIFVEEVEVTPSEEAHVIFPCSCWLSEDKEDGRLERDVFPGQPKPPRPNTSYHLAVKTGDLPLAGTDANVYFQLVGDKGETEKIQLRQGGKAEKRFDRGRTDKFIVETVDVGQVQKLRVGHDNEGTGPGWFLDEVIVDVPAHSDHFVFPCRRWLADNEDDGKIERDLYPGVPVFPPGSPGTSPVKTRTVIEKTTTTYETRTSPYSTPTKSPAQEPRYSSGPLQKKSLPESAPYPSKTPIEDEPIRHAAAPSLQSSAHDYSTPTKKPLPEGEDYYFNTPYQPTPPSRPTDDAPPARPPAPIGAAETDLQFEEPMSQSGAAYPRKDHGGSEELLDMDSRKIVAYQLCLKMGDVLGDGTEGSVFIQLFGDNGMTEKIQLRQTGNSKIRFEKGRTYKFTVETVDIGKIDKVLVGHDSTNEGAGWYLEEVTVDVPFRGEHTVFPSRCWLADEKGDGATVRELVSRPCLYHLALKTGDDKNASTDANVWVQVFGKKGDTGRVELKRGGAAENLFERGQTDYFTLDAADVGKVEMVRVGHDGRGASSAWYLEEVVLNSAEKGEHLVLPCHAWIADDEGDGSLAKDLYPKDVVNYSVTIKTGSVKNAGTDSNIYMQMFGDQGDTGVIELKQITDTHGKFKRGMTTKIPLQTTDVGNLEMIRIGHDGRGLGTGWFLEEVMVIAHDQCWVFPCMRWLADYEDDGKVERELRAGKKTYAHEPDLQDLIEYLQTDDITLITNSASYLQHLCFSDEGVKAKIRELGGIPILVRLLDHEAEEVHRSAASCLRNLSYSKERDENKLAIAECGGIEALMRLLKRTPRDAVKEVVLGVLWNLSSCDDLKARTLELCLVVLVITIIIPYSGWSREAARSGRPVPEIKWSTVFRNASGILRNISSAGVEARQEMRACEGLVDSFVWIVRAPIGKNDIDNKSVENSVCILRNLSYRLEMEVDRERYEDAPLPTQAPDKEHAQQGCVMGCGSAARRKAVPRPSDESLNRKELVEGVELLWHPEVIRPYLSIMAEASNPETLEGAAGAIHNLTACRWRWAVILRSTVRKEKGLPILVELLRMSSDPVVRAVTTALRNLAIDPRNRDLIGKFATRDLVHCLPAPDAPSQSVEENTVGALLCAVHQLVNRNLGNGKYLRNHGGLKKIVPIAKSSAQARYSPKIVKTANQVLITLWNLAPLRPALKKESWEYTTEISQQYGQAPSPRPFEDITMPRGGQPRGTLPTRGDQSTIPEAARFDATPARPEPPLGYTADEPRVNEACGSQEELELRDITGQYAELDLGEPGPELAARAPAQDWQASSQPEPTYAVIDKKKKSLRLEGDADGVGDSWV